MSVVILFLAFVAMASSQEGTMIISLSCKALYLSYKQYLIEPNIITACNFECDNKIMNPVCGSDDFTYPNTCQMLNSNCHPITGKVKVTAVKSGHCRGRAVN